MHQWIVFRNTGGDQILMKEVSEHILIHLHLLIAAGLLIQGFEDYSES